MKLTEIQKIAVQAAGKNILVSAGAGTGKTRVLVERFLHLVAGGQALVTEILALTFTEKAANEMKTRILERLSQLGLESARRDLESAYISTVHAFAARLLREHPLEAGLDPEFRVIESEEALYLKEQAMDEAMDSRCEKGSGIFELVRVYGENRIRDGAMKLLDTARHEGRYLDEYFKLGCAQNGRGEEEFMRAVADKFHLLGETQLAGEFRRFALRENWDWETVEEFKAWCGGFSHKRGKKGENHWPELKKMCRDFMALKVECLAAPWKESFEKLCLAYEERYENKKRERGFLDFDDLQIRALRLLKEDGPGRQRLRDHYRCKFRQIMVDEFQDTNYLQLELIEALSSGSNLFFVGDYKQSIYAFRGAEPALFLEKERAYRDGGKGLWIPLVENFRTAQPVLDFINGFFAGMWEEDGIAYEALLCGSGQHEGPGVELMKIIQEEDESIDRARMREAEGIAEKILALQEEGIPFGEMAVLFQAMTGIGLYEQALKKRGIPYYILSGGGFYHQPEIRDLMSYLSFLENPLADIPLAAALRSPLFQVTDNTLFWLSFTAKKEGEEEKASAPLWAGLKQVESIVQIPEEEKEKVLFFLRVTEELLRVKDRLKLSEFLNLILSQTSYELTVLSDPQGIRRYANLKKMVNLARELETAQPLSIGDFLRTLRRLELQEVRESEAQIEAEQSGLVVRLLSVHRAKGLEFSAVFVADLGRGRQSAEAKTFLAHAGRGYALQAFNEKTYEFEETLRWRLLNEYADRKDKEERKRLFYVAATRAKQRLILSGACKEKKKEKNHFYEMNSWMDWVCSAENASLTLCEGLPSAARRRRRSIAEKKELRELFRDFRPQPLEKVILNPALLREAEAGAGKIFRSIQPISVKRSRAIDLPVSAFAVYSKNPKQYWRTYELGYADAVSGEFPAEGRTALPPEEDETSAADFGTLMHLALEKMDFQRMDEESLDLLAERYFGGLSRQRGREARAILSRFAASPLAAELRSAGQIHRELPFVLNERHGLIYGVIDVLFQDQKGDWHILDYKTAEGDAQKASCSGYELQIVLYAHAVRRIAGIEPRSAVLYFLKNGWRHTVDLGPAALELAGRQIRDLQENLLDFDPF